MIYISLAFIINALIDKLDNDEMGKVEHVKLSTDQTVTNSGKQESIVLDIDVRPNDHRVLDLLADDRSTYTFNGLVRKLGIHQETLSRALHRLGDMGLVEKSKIGYKLSEKGKIVAVSEERARVAYVPLFQTYIPSSVSANDLVYALAGKWFNGLRWLGMIEGEMGHTLQWISENNSFQINLRIVNGYIVIETNATSDNDRLQAMMAAYGVFHRLLRYLRANYRTSSGVAFYTTFSDVNQAN